MDTCVLFGFNALMSKKNLCGDDGSDNEAELNPAPKKYRVSLRIKSFFILLFLLGIIFYIQMIVDRRVTQRKFLTQNQMEAIRLEPFLVQGPTVYSPLDDSRMELEQEFKGWTLLNIWASWCPPCKAEMPSLEFLQQRLKGKLKIIALSVDDQVDVVKEFIDTFKPSFRVLWDQQGGIPKKFGITKYPETFLISPDGRLTTQFSGPRDWASPMVIDYFSNLF